VSARTGPDSDAAFVVKSLASPSEFQEIFVRHARTVNRYFARRVGADVAEELVAEVFLAAFRIRDRYDPARADVRPWLFGISSNVLARHRRDEARYWKMRASLGTEPSESLTPADEADERVAAQAERPRLIAALRRLRKVDREVLLLFAWEGLSYDEIAEALGIPVGTVRSLLSRSRRQLRDALGADPRAESALPTLDELLNGEVSG